jgi:hypothetical protein
VRQPAPKGGPRSPRSANHSPSVLHRGTRKSTPVTRFTSVIESKGRLGCAFIRASVEFPDVTHPVHCVATEHKEMIRSYFRGLAAQANARNPSQLAEQIYLLFEGAIVASQLYGDPWPADCAGRAAELLLAAASDQSARPGSRARGGKLLQRLR